MRGLGCKPPVAPPHLHRMAFRMHPKMTSDPPAASDLRNTGRVAAVKDQGDTSSCEGHSSSGATETALALQGNSLGFIPSEACIYAGARALERARATPARLTLPALTDEGAQTEDVLSFLSTFGVRPRRVTKTSDGRNSDVETATVNDELKLDELEAAAACILVGPYAVDPAAADAEVQVKAALTALIPVRVDAFVDAEFESWMPGDDPVPAPNMRDPNGGGHAIYIVGYTPECYVVRNSWGTGWGDGGDVEVSPAWLRKAWGLYPWVVRRLS